MYPDMSTSSDDCKSINDNLVSFESTEALSDYIESHVKKIKG
jgi:hypothetical protein